jgi:hypothetical protein
MMGWLDSLIDDDAIVTASCEQSDWERSGKGEDDVRQILAEAEEHRHLGGQHNISVKINVEA